MGTRTKHPGFGQKHDGAQSFAEALLTGKPIGRAAVRATTPKLKPRAKPSFGRGALTASPALDAKMSRNRTPARKHGWRFWTGIVLAVLLGAQALLGVFNLPSPTLGGRQLWTDIRVQGGWRVQCHAWTGHCRLLDAHDIRRTWGEEAEVLAAFDQAFADGDIPAPVNMPKAVVLVHGLGRSAHSFDALADAFRAQGYEVVAFNYASTRAGVEGHARALNRVVAGLEGVREVNFVTHSLGAVVLRQALALAPEWTQRLKTGRAVLLAGPNQGSSVADTLKYYAPARWLFGPALGELADADAVKRLPAPPTFATVAGTRNPLWFFDAPSDGLVSVEEARLAGAAEQLQVDAAHTFIMDDADVIRFATGFIAGQ